MLAVTAVAPILKPEQRPDIGAILSFSHRRRAQSRSSRPRDLSRNPGFEVHTPYWESATPVFVLTFQLWSRILIVRSEQVDPGQHARGRP